MGTDYGACTCSTGSTRTARLSAGATSRRRSEADQAKPTVEVVASLLRLEDAEAVVAETDLVKRGDMLRQSKYRGAMIYALVDDTTVNLGSSSRARRTPFGITPRPTRKRQATRRTGNRSRDHTCSTRRRRKAYLIPPTRTKMASCRRRSAKPGTKSIRTNRDNVWTISLYSALSSHSLYGLSPTRCRRRKEIENHDHYGFIHCRVPVFSRGAHRLAAESAATTYRRGALPVAPLYAHKGRRLDTCPQLSRS